LHGMGDTPPLLERAIASFVSTYREGDDGLSVTGTPDDIGRWRSACHSLRGALATIGALQLAAQAQRFEEELRTDVEAPLRALQALRLQAQLRSLVLQLEEALGTNSH